MCIYTFVYKSLKYFQKKSHTPRLNFLLWGKEIGWRERELTCIILLLFIILLFTLANTFGILSHVNVYSNLH